MLIKIRYRAAGALFVHPMDPVPRTAVLAPHFRETKLIRVFPEGWSVAAARFHPTSVAAPAAMLQSLTKLGIGLEHAVVVLTYEGKAGLSEEDRDLFWSVWGVPVFEQYLSAANELLATECDAHAGLHQVGNWPGILEREICACGAAAPRISRGSGIDDLAGLLA